MLQDTVTAPDEPVADDLPTWRSEFAEWWEKRLRPFIDLRSFLHQRRLILQHPELTYCTQAPEKHWKLPFEFALSASLLTFGFCAIIGLMFHTAFPDPDTKHDWIARAISARIGVLDSQRKTINPADPKYASVAAREESAREDLREHINGMSIPHGNILVTVGTSLLVYLIGVFYPALVRLTPARAAPRASSVRRIVYYYFAARTFWPVFIFVTAGAIVYFAERYSILSYYDSVSQTYVWTNGPGLLVLNVVGGIVAVAFLYAIVATPIEIHRCARRLPDLIGVTEASTHRILYWGLHVTVACAFVAAFIIALFAAGAYSALDTWTDDLHHYTAAEFLTQ